jgi:hypothetical protein
MNKKLFIIIGKSNSHKSSVIRCVTGCPISQGNWKIKLSNNQIEDFYVAITSPQERNNVGLAPSDFISELKGKNEESILIALQSTSTSNQPNGEVYLQAFIDKGFDIQKIACFDSEAELLGLTNQLFNTQNIPSNETASLVKDMWEII